MTQAMIYTTDRVPLHRVKPGGRIEHNGCIYKVFRVLRAVRPGGYVAIAVARDAAGGWDGESVALWFASRDECVRLVCGAEAPSW